MFIKLIIDGAFALLEKFLLRKITYQPLRDYIQSHIDPLMEIVGIITDKNPNNNEQFKLFWNEQKNSFAHRSIDFAIDVIRQSVKDPETIQILVDVLTGIKEGETLKGASA